MSIQPEQKFYSALEDAFIGEAGKDIEGKSGYVNLMKLKSKYFKKIKPFIEEEIEAITQNNDEKLELYQKLYTFFESYLNETGTPFFSQTPYYKNLYEKVYTEKEDVTLNWKTQRLYYVKTETNYGSIDNLEINGVIFNFDASNIEHQKNNEKKEIDFFLIGIENNKLYFKVLYEDKSNKKWDKLKNYLQLGSASEIRKYLARNLEDINHPNINIIKNNLTVEELTKNQLEEAFLFINNYDINDSVTIEFAPNTGKIEVLNKYLLKKGFYNENLDSMKRAFSIYKKQNEVDYFIHKDAESFLKEQFDLYIYNYLFGERHLYNEWNLERVELIQKLKQVAYTVIDYISKFENELIYVWNKPKFVLNSNYVFTLEKIQDNIDLVRRITEHKNFEKQVAEWNQLNISKDIEKEYIIEDGALKEQLKYLPIDTKFFKSLEAEIIKQFNDLEKHIDGYLIKSDNYQALNTIKNKFYKDIKTIYIDPPFNKEGEADYLYKVKFKNSTWVTMLENRISPSRDLLSNTGCIFVRCDYNGNFYVRLLLDNIFGKQNFRNEIVVNRFKRQLEELKRLNFAHESLLYYAKASEHTPNKIYRSRICTFCGSISEPAWRPMTSPGLRISPIPQEEINRYSEKNILYKDGKFYTRARIIKGRELLPPRDRHWTFSQKRIDEMDFKERIRINNDKSYIDLNGGKNVGEPEYLQTEEVPIDTYWSDLKGYAFGSNFQTENAEELLRRVIEFTSNEDDMVMDYFLGSGTTTAVAHKLKRKWIGVESGEQFYSHILPRMKKVLAGKKSGITENLKRKGGGFFKYYELEQYEDALAKAKYSPKDDNISKINFSTDEKLLDAMIIDRENEKVKIHFEFLYPDVDIAETISNITGKRIKKLDKKRVIFEDSNEIVFDKMEYNDPIFGIAYKKLLWWKSEGE